ncbi:MAG: nucleotidyltransferase domain-containing protein [Bacteroidales bacterium]|nr:nucleotidyltransferase domain-containing protein [Bacteroidales bacterium]
MNQSTTIKKISEGIDNILAKVSPLKSQAILFGSRARGDARDDSDWDVLILLDKDRITQSDIDEVSYPIRELGWEIDAMVNPIMYTMKEWKSKSFTPFYKNVMREGVAI